MGTALTNLPDADQDAANETAPVPSSNERGAINRFDTLRLLEWGGSKKTGDSRTGGILLGLTVEGRPFPA